MQIVHMGHPAMVPAAEHLPARLPHISNHTKHPSSDISLQDHNFVSFVGSSVHVY